MARAGVAPRCWIVSPPSSLPAPAYPKAVVAVNHMAKKLIDGHPLPKRISESDFEELVTPANSKPSPWEIPQVHAASAKVRLNNIVDYIAANMRHPAPKRKAVRSAVQSAVKALGKARDLLGEIPTGDHVLASLDTLRIATIVNDQWLCEFSGGEFQPRRGHDPGPELGWREIYIEQEQWGLEIATALVGQIEAALMPSLEWTTKKTNSEVAKPFLIGNC